MNYHDIGGTLRLRFQRRTDERNFPQAVAVKNEIPWWRTPRGGRKNQQLRQKR